MSLTRYLPIPSERMGILWTLLSIKDAIIVEYGTAGTTAYASKIFGCSGLDPHGRLFTTGLSETNVVMGDTTVLEEKLLELDQTYHPKVLFVLASSTSSIIGTDIKGVCNAMADKVNATIIPFTQGGFGGDYSKGCQSTYTTLVDTLATEIFPTENCYNLMGVSPSWNCEDVATVKTMMSTHFGLQPYTQLCYDTSLTAITQMAKAKINLVVSYEGLQSAKILAQRFGTPYVYGLPVGTTGTNQWLHDVGTVLGTTITPAPLPQPMGHGKDVVIYADQDKALALGQCATELGYNVTHIITPHKPTKGTDVIYFKTETEKIAFFKELKNALILGDETFAMLADSTNVKRCVHALPLDGGSVLPVLGTGCVAEIFTV